MAKFECFEGHLEGNKPGQISLHHMMGLTTKRSLKLLGMVK